MDIRNGGVPHSNRWGQTPNDAFNRNKAYSTVIE